MHHMIARARFHGRRLARENKALSAGLIGSIGYHEGADVSVEAMRTFSRELRASYDAQRVLDWENEARITSEGS
jgi:hypothetical protein